MNVKRKIAMVVKKVSFAEAEETDDIYWSKTTPEYRLKTLMDLREMNNLKAGKIVFQKIVFKKNIHEEVEAGK